VEEIRITKSDYEPPQTQRIRKVNAIIIEKKPRFWERLIGSHSDEIADYALWEVLIPALKSTITDIISNSIEMLFYGEPRRGSRDRGDRSKVSYTQYYGDRDRGKTEHYYARKSRYEFDDIVMPTRQDCEDILGQLIDLIDDYGKVSVSELYDIVGKGDEYVDQKWGWTNLSQAGYRSVRNGWILDLPKPKPLN
jgi:hypothetical protein